MFLLRGHLEDGSPRFPTMAGATIPFLYGTVVSNIVVDMSQAHYANSGELTVRVEPRGDKYIWELHRDYHYQPVKFSAPIYLSEGSDPTIFRRTMSASKHRLGHGDSISQLRVSTEWASHGAVWCCQILESMKPEPARGGG